MMIFKSLFWACIIWACADARVGNVFKRIGGNYRNVKLNAAALERSAEVAGYSFGALGTYWRSNTLAAHAKMSRGEIEDAMETINTAIATLTVWDLGQNIAYPLVDKFVHKLLLKNNKVFPATFDAYEDYTDVMKTGVLDEGIDTAEALKSSLTQKKKAIGIAFESDVAKIMKNKNIYKTLVTDLKHVKTSLKVIKWADVIAGPLFDAATVAVSAWQLSEAVKSGDPGAIAASSLSLASGVVGLAGFVVGALATAGSTLAAVAGPVGALVGAILGITALLVEIFTSWNPYTQINNDLKMIRDLRDRSKKILNMNVKNLPQMVPERNTDFQFSWIYQVNQGLMAQIQGRWYDSGKYVKFILENPPKEQNGYMVVGPERHLDKGKYPDNWFWNPEGLEEIGYDFYGKKVTDKFNGATVLVNTSMVAGVGVKLKHFIVQTYKDVNDPQPDNVVIDDMYDLHPKATRGGIIVRTGYGSDVIQINGLLGIPEIGNDKGMIYEHYGEKWRSKSPVIFVEATGRDYKSRTTRTEETDTDILSFEGMPKELKHDKKIVGVVFEIYYGNLFYRIPDSSNRPVNYYWGRIEGIKMFVGTPYDDIVDIFLAGRFIIRETRGRNEYMLFPKKEYKDDEDFLITIDDQSQTPGKITMEDGKDPLNVLSKRCLKFSKADRILYIYMYKLSYTYSENSCSRNYIARVQFSRHAAHNHPVYTVPDRKRFFLEDLPEPTEDDFSYDSDDFPQAMFDHAPSQKRTFCFNKNIVLYPPGPKEMKFVVKAEKAKNQKRALLLSADFIRKCVKKEKLSVMLLRNFAVEKPSWYLKVFKSGKKHHKNCPASGFKMPIEDHIEKLMEQGDHGTNRLVVDLRQDRRLQIDVNLELTKLAHREHFRFDKNFEGKHGVSQDVMLQPPSSHSPSSTLRFFLNIKGGQQWNPDALTLTDELRKWLKDNKRKIVLTKVSEAAAINNDDDGLSGGDKKEKMGGKDEEGDWRMEIRKEDGTVTHGIKLKNVERIDYEAADGSVRLPIVTDLGTETRGVIDMEATTLQDLPISQEDKCQ